MSKLRLLLVEDVETDAMLAKRQIERAGIDLESKTVWDAESYEQELDFFRPDVVLSDYSLPQFNALEALRILKGKNLDIPFLLYTGTQSEEVAVECMRAGADDYLLKSSLTRLPEAIRNAIESREIKRREAQAMAALRSSEESFRALIENTPDSVAVVRLGVIVYVNPSFLDFIGLDRNQLMQRPFCDVVHEADKETCRERIKATDKIHTEEVGSRYLRADGTTIYGETSVIPVSFQGAPAVAVVIRDVTEKRQMQARLLLADRLASVGTLAAGVAHEINNPLGYLLTNLDSIEDDLGVSLEQLTELLKESNGEFQRKLTSIYDMLEDLREPVQIARRGADRVRNIVRDLMMLARSDYESQEQLDLNAVIDFTLKMAANEIKRKAILEVDLQPVEPVLANESRLGQVFLNLVINALQALPERPMDENKIRVATRMEDNCVVAEFSDNGMGIPESVQSRIFDPFFTTKPVGVGTGLGLSICHSLVTKVGGSITVDSKENEGTTFRIKLQAASGA